jgi:hypothetical protein
VFVGATALGVYRDMQWRKTADVDLVLTLKIEERKLHPRKEH